MLQARGLKSGDLPEHWNVDRPNDIKQIHLEYLKSGSDIITTNTFGANGIKYQGEGKYSLENIIKCAIKCAKDAVEEYGKEDKYVALDIGPSGKLLKPLGDLEFNDAVVGFAEVARLGQKYGADLVIIETMNDSYETKSALLAVKENCDLPVFVTNAYDESNKLMTGASPFAMVTMLEGLGADAIGVNCSVGPDKMSKVVDDLVKYASVPVIVSPNAGLPTLKNGKTCYDLSPEEFAKYMKNFASKGVAIMGGCCGTNPEYIAKLYDATKDIPYNYPTDKNITAVSSYTMAVEFGTKPVLIGERINPTGKKLFKEALRNGDYDYSLKEAISQQEQGADILDINVGLPEIDEAEVLVRTVKEVQGVSNLPLQIDTSNPVAMERAVREYNGKPLINSVNGKQESMDEILPIASKYGGVLIALTLDENGIPNTAKGRVEIAEKIIAEAKKYGISKKNIVVDPLAMTVSSDTSSALVTLESVKILHQKGIKTCLGVSNVSFGLPNRDTITSTFFAIALQNGLSGAIMNPYSKKMMDVYYGFCALSNLDSQCAEYIKYSTDNAEPVKETKQEDVSPKTALKNAILKGLKDDATTYSTGLLNEINPLEIIDLCIIPALNEMGERFEKQQAFLPQLLMSAESAKCAFDVIKQKMLADGGTRNKKCKIVLATVKDDIHDIGKNIVKTLLENYDFDVIDLGKDVPPETIVNKVVEENVPLVGLSALMTTTVPSMEETIKQLRAKVPNCKVVVGGAVLTQEYADMIGADKYSKDAMETVRYAESII